MQQDTAIATGVRSKRSTRKDCKDCKDRKQFNQRAKKDVTRA